MSRFTGGEKSEGTRRKLPEGTYRIKHRWTTQVFKDSKYGTSSDIPLLRLELRKADEEDCIEWLSCGKAYEYDKARPNEDGTNLMTESGADATLNQACRAAEYLQAFASRAKLKDEDVFNCSVLDQYEVTISLQPNTSQFAKAGATKPVLVGVNPLKATSKRKGNGRSQTAPQNGEDMDIAVGFTVVQMKGLTALQRLIEAKAGDVDLTTLTVKDLLPYSSGRSQVEKIQTAQAALSDEVLAAL